MANFTNETNNTFTFVNTDTELSAMDSLVDKIKELIIHKKLEQFQVLDYSILPPKPPVLKPSLNSIEINAALNEIRPGELTLGKSTLSSKVMVYMDENGIAWQVAAQFNNEIINVEFCGKKVPSPGTNSDTTISNHDLQIEEISNLPEHNEICWSGTNIFNKTNSLEYKMIISSVIKGVVTEPYIGLDMESVEKISNTLNFLGPWKVMHVKSVPNVLHVFATKNADGTIWVVVTDWTIKHVCYSYQLA